MARLIYEVVHFSVSIIIYIYNWSFASCLLFSLFLYVIFFLLLGADELRPLLLELSCDNLRCDHSGRPPNSMLVLMGSLAPAIWDTCGHTEVVEVSGSQKLNNHLYQSE